MRVGLTLYGDLEERSGGFRYDRRLVAELRAAGDEVEVVSLPWRTYPRGLLDGLSSAVRRRLAVDVDVMLQDELAHPSLVRHNRRLPYPVVSVVHHLRASERRRLAPPSRAVERAYHRHMDEKTGGDSRAGSHALSRLRRRPGATVLDVAGSDWAVRPVSGSYPGSEAALLEYVLDTVETAVGETTGPGFAATLEEWLATRRRQLEAGELTYTTHQLDLLGRVDLP